MSRVVAVHQPDFFPWLGLFRKIGRSHVFIILDHVQFPKKGGSWLNRVKVLVGGQPKFVTCPINRPSGFERVSEKLIAPVTAWPHKFMTTLSQSYAKTPYFKQTMEIVESCIQPSGRLMDMNMAFINRMIGKWGLESEVVYSSDSLNRDPTLDDCQGSVLLCRLCKQHQATAYLAGDGAAGYEDLDVYQEAGLDHMVNGFTPTPYRQHGSDEFVPGLSTLDALFNLGVSETREMLRL